MNCNEENSLHKLSDSDFLRLSQVIHQHCGIKLPSSKKAMLEGRLLKRLKFLNGSSLKDYCDYVLTSEGTHEELSFMIDVVTTHKTDFFREPHHFFYLTNMAVPELWKLRGGYANEKIMVWSAACSTGEEPYTMAMVLGDISERMPGFKFHILATDISEEVLSRAEQAVYEVEKIDPIPIDLRKKYLLRSIDPQKRMVRIVPELRQKVSFLRMNLTDSFHQINEDIDIIFCRNVLIYFDSSTQKDIIRRFCKLLKPGGYLFMGHSETLNNMNLPLKYVAPTIYRKGHDL